jgi:hypothetical protein
MDQAAQIYTDMLEEQPSCEIAHKRLVGFWIAAAAEYVPSQQLTCS